uniref:Drebrin n=1 Tax=Amazona collaria TaxID=241587 RepID=A0A8B9GAP6_9PSIT
MLPPAVADPHCLPRALYTYEDGSDDLKLAASGGGGLLELSGHFEIQKVMYGFCSVKDPQAVLPKYVLVNWVGEDVPDARKCACASHVAKIAEFFQGVDVIVNASSVEDIDPGAIGQRLSNGLARVSSPVLHRLRLREDENTEPVGTTYQKTDATVEMKRLNREQFWEQAKKEEELRKEEERKKALDARLRFEQERMEQERLEQEERERRYREREEQIEEHRRKQQSMEAEEARQRLKEQSIFGEQQEEDDRQQLRKSESEVEEAAAIIAQRPDNPRDFFKQQERVASGSSDAISPASQLLPPSKTRPPSPPGDEPSPRPVWTAGGDILGDLVTLEPAEPSPPPTATEPQPGGTPNPESLIDLWQSDGAAPPSCLAPACCPCPRGTPAARAPPPPSAMRSRRRRKRRRRQPAGGGPQPGGLGCQSAPQEDAPGRETPPITNGEMAPKDGTPGRGEQVSIAGGEEPSAKAPQPVFYNKPPEIDITCWDADPLPEEEESFGGGSVSPGPAAGTHSFPGRCGAWGGPQLGAQTPYHPAGAPQAEASGWGPPRCTPTPGHLLQPPPSPLFFKLLVGAVSAPSPPLAAPPPRCPSAPLEGGDTTHARIPCPAMGQGPRSLRAPPRESPVLCTSDKQKGIIIIMDEYGNKVT